MRVALLHLDLSGGPEERNLEIIQQYAMLAADCGAKWIITPETAVQGYFFSQKERNYKIPVQPDLVVGPLQRLIAERGLTFFLCCAEQDEITGNLYNSCLVIGEDGIVLGRHRKVRSPGSAEAWAAKGDNLSPIQCGKINVGVLICADAYFEENAKKMREKNAQVIVVPAAWPPGYCGGPPENAWMRCSDISGLPVWVCNQTGNRERMDMSQAQSAVVVDGKMELAYSGLRQAALLFDWDMEKRQLLSTAFHVISV